VKSLKAIVLAGGTARDGDRGPAGMWARQLVPIANRPLVCHALDMLREAGIEQVAVVSGPETGAKLRQAIEASDSASNGLSYVEHDEQRGLGDALHAAESFLGGAPFVLHLADSLTTRGLRRFVRLEDSDPTDALVLMQDAPAVEAGGVVELTSGRLLGVLKRSAETANDVVPAGVYVFGPRVLDAAQAIPADGQGELGVAAAVEGLLRNGGRVRTQCVDAWWRYRARPEALLEANRLMLEQLPRTAPTALREDIRLEGRVLVHPTAELESVTIRGPAIVGPGASVRHAYVGPYTAIGQGVTIEGAEVENSIILPGATVSHAGCRLEASVVGNRAKVTRDFRLPTALRLCVGDGAEVSLG
jgi:glucose-1-phosphate thymidylyltransferase